VLTVQGMFGIWPFLPSFSRGCRGTSHQVPIFTVGRGVFVVSAKQPWVFLQLDRLIEFRFSILPFSDDFPAGVENFHPSSRSIHFDIINTTCVICVNL
jgi:hypothetical protein